VDFVKDMSTDFIFPLMQHGALGGKFGVGEFFDGDLGLLHGWVSDPAGMRRRARYVPDRPLFVRTETATSATARW